MKKISWYFKISEQAGLASDEDGKNVSCYCEYKMEFKNDIEKNNLSYEEQAKIILQEVSKNIKVPMELISIVSEKEYIENTEA